MIPKSPIYKKAQICCSAFTQKNPMSPPDGVGMGFFACRGCFLIESMLYSVQQIGITETAPVPDSFGRAGGTCTLSFGSVWKSVDCGGRVPKSKL